MWYIHDTGMHLYLPIHILHIIEPLISIRVFRIAITVLNQYNITSVKQISSQLQCVVHAVLTPQHTHTHPPAPLQSQTNKRPRCPSFSASRYDDILGCYGQREDRKKKKTTSSLLLEQAESRPLKRHTHSHTYLPTHSRTPTHTARMDCGSV